MLARLGAEAGLDAVELERLLGSDAHAATVRADETEAQALGITGVPFFVLAGRYAVSGAQSPDALLGALEQAAASVVPSGYAEGAACGLDGCS